MTDRSAALVQRLEEVFDGLPVPAPEKIVYASSGYNLESLEVADLLGGHHWRDLTVDDLRYQQDSLHFLSPEGFRFYLPAFARFVLVDFDEADLAPMVIVWLLGYSDEHTRQRIAILTDPQRQVLADCVKYIVEQAPEDFTHEDIQRALTNLQGGAERTAPNS